MQCWFHSALSHALANRTICMPVLEKWYGPSQLCMLTVSPPPVHSHSSLLVSDFPGEKWDMQLVLKGLRSVGNNFWMLGIWRLPRKLLLGTYRGRNCCCVPLYFSALAANPKLQDRGAVACRLLRFSSYSCSLVCTKCRSTGEKSATSVPKLLSKFLLYCQTSVMTCCQFLRESCNHCVFKQCCVRISKTHQHSSLRRISLEELPIWHFIWGPWS